jgi:hypothetical protein
MGLSLPVMGLLYLRVDDLASEKTCSITTHEILNSKHIACHLTACVHSLVITADESELCISTTEGKIIECTVHISISVMVNETCFKGPTKKSS